MEVGPGWMGEVGNCAIGEFSGCAEVDEVVYCLGFEENVGWDAGLVWVYMKVLVIQMVVLASI